MTGASYPNLPARWLDKRYTPGRKDLPELFATLSLGDKESCSIALKVLRRIQTDITQDLIKAMFIQSSTALAWLLRALGERLEISNSEKILPHILPHLDAQDQRLTRYAVHALSRLDTLPESIEAKLWKILSSGETSVKKAVFETLRKAGTAKFLPELDKINLPAEFLQASAELRLTLNRKRPMPTSSLGHQTDFKLTLPTSLECYPGLETLLAEACKVQHLSVTTTKPGLVTVGSGANWKDLWSVRLFDRLSFTCHVPLGSAKELAAKTYDVLFSEILAPLTEGIVSYRLDVSVATASRDFRTNFCTEIQRLSARFQNQTQQALWQIEIEEFKSGFKVTCSPSRSADPRFKYRQQAALGASHPTIAAALVALAQCNGNDTIWDPFAGGGTELIEACLAAKPRRLLATEGNTEAQELMRQRFFELQLTPPEIVACDAMQFHPKGVTKIITNPPLGRRLRNTDPLALGEKLLRHLAKESDYGVVLSWMNPSHRTLGPLAEQLGLRLERNFHVNMGGITLYMERRVKQTETFKKLRPSEAKPTPLITKASKR